MKKIKIKNYEIGKNFPPFIIAEAGINHNGDLKKALKMIDIAKNNAKHNNILNRLLIYKRNVLSRTE